MQKPNTSLREGGGGRVGKGSRARGVVEWLRCVVATTVDLRVAICERHLVGYRQFRASSRPPSRRRRRRSVPYSTSLYRTRTARYHSVLLQYESYSYMLVTCIIIVIPVLYEAGRLYGTTEVIPQCTEHEAPLNLFYCCFMPIWAPTMVQRVQNSGRGLFHGGCRAKPAISGLGVHGRTNNALA